MSYKDFVVVCESVWNTIRHYNPDVPEAFVVVGSGGRKAPTTYGHFAKERWEIEGQPIHEVLLVAEQLNRSGTEVFTTLLHESVHGIATTRDIRDTSGKRHNKKFAQLCEEVGLIPPTSPDSVLGYSAATLSDMAIELYSPEIQKLDDALKFFRKLSLVAGAAKKSLWAAECSCGRKIRLGKKAIEDPDVLNIHCYECDSDFELTEEYV